MFGQRTHIVKMEIMDISSKYFVNILIENIHASIVLMRVNVPCPAVKSDNSELVFNSQQSAVNINEPN